MMRNKLILGNCIRILREIPDNSINAIITDPPYLYLDHKLDSDFDENLFFSECYRVLAKNSFLAFFGRGESYFKWNYICNNLGFKFKEEIIWDKKYISSPVLPVGRCHENITILAKGTPKLNKIYIDNFEQKQETGDFSAIIEDFKRIITGLKSIKDFNEFEDFRNYRLYRGHKALKHRITCHTALRDNDRGCDTFKTYDRGRLMPSIIRIKRENYTYEHPTQKPVKLINFLVEMLSQGGELVLDPFAGSGTLAIACLETGRDYICIEKLSEYYQISQNRINDWHNDQRNRTGTHNLPDDIERINYDNHGQLSLF